LQNVYAPAITAVELVGTLVVLAVGVSELARGRLSLGELIAFGAFLEALFSPVRRLAGTITDIAAAGAGAERLIDLLDGPEPHTVRVGRRRPDLLVPLLELDRVGFDYPDGTPVLRDLDLVVRPGEVVAVNGPSGIGKSTLIKILLRFYDPTRGQVRLGGFDLTELDAEYVRQATAVVWQDPLCFDTSIADNVRIGRPDAEDPEVWRALRAADLDGFVAGLPDGLHSPVGQRGRRLSGGQLRRLGLARALVREAPVLIMDEPTAGLDAATADRILQAVRRSSAGRATLVVTHDPAVLGWADRVITVDRIRQQEPVR
jgi:ABC-type multidrug transport system fused ATPase/permease subunit